MNKKILTAAVVLAAMGGCAATAAETPVYTLDAVVVTANRTETKELDTNADVSVVTAKDIEQHHYKDVGEAIKQVPGVSVQTQGASQVYFSDIIYINGSKNVVVMVDGVRQNLNGLTIGSAAPVANFTNMDSIDRIEVMKGSASTLYGSDAQGGVINIITKKPEDGTMKTKVGASFGSYDGEKYNLYHEGAKNGFFWTVDAHKQLQGDFKDGWGRNVVNHLNAKSYAVKFGKDLGNDSSIALNYQKYKSNYTTPAGGSLDTTRTYGKKDLENIALSYNAKVTDRLDTQLSLYKNQTEYDDHTAGPFEFTSQTVGFSNQWTYKLEDHVITGGIDYYKDKIRHYLGSGEDTEVSGKSIGNTAFFLQDIWQINDKWSLTPGVRVDHNDRFGNHTSPSLVLGYKPTERTNYYLSYKEFFVAPNLYQLYADTSYSGEFASHYKGNPDLKPAEGQTYEFGVHHQFDDSLYGTFSIYRQHSKNMIDAPYVSYENGVSQYVYQNTGKMDLWGWNAQLNKTFNEHLNGFVGYSYYHAKSIDSTTYNDNNDGALPESTINVGLNYSNAKLNAYIDGQGIMNRQGPKSTHKYIKDYGSFWVWNVGADYQIHPNANVFVKVNNVFDQFYSAVGTSQDPYGSLIFSPYGNYNLMWYSAPGRNYEVGVSFQF